MKNHGATIMGSASKRVVTRSIAVDPQFDAGLESRPSVPRLVSPGFRKLAHEIEARSTVLGLNREPSSQTDYLTLSAEELGEMIKGHIASRQRRAKFFPADIFADPAWDILLEVFLADIEQRRLTISCACMAACVPPTTALRWISSMTATGLLERYPDRHDGRRHYVQLSTVASQSMRSYFSEEFVAASRNLA